MKRQLSDKTRAVLREAGRRGGYRRAELHDGVVMTAKARNTFDLSFFKGHECRVCPRIDLPNTLSETERMFRAASLRRGHFVNVGRYSAIRRGER